MIYLLTFIEYRYSLLATFAPLLEPAIPKLIVRLRCACQKFYLFSSASVWAIIGVVYRRMFWYKDWRGIKCNCHLCLCETV